MNAAGIRSVFMLAPEAPYPLQGGGAYRTASLLNYFARFAEVDLILISDSGEPALLPPGLVRRQVTIPLPHHSKTRAARYLRNAGRILRGVPPLIDRLSGLQEPILNAIGPRHYDLGIVEHFWCAPYIDMIKASCAHTVLDLHNIESVLHRRCARVGHGLSRAGHNRFARLCEQLEVRYLPKYSEVLTTSEPDAAAVRQMAPQCSVRVFPNAIPAIEPLCVPEQPAVVFSGNFEYHPNIDAVAYLVSQIWPRVRVRHPELRLKLVGRGDVSIRHLIAGQRGIDTTGSVPDALSEIAAAEMVIAPLRAGSGTRIKILEAWAANRAVIATPLAAEGLEYRDGENIMLAGNADAFVHAIGQLTEKPKERERLGRNGRRTYMDHYTWEAAWRSLDADPLFGRGAEPYRYTV